MEHFPSKKMIVYDLGLTPIQTLLVGNFCNVEYRRFEFENYPKEVKKLLHYRWKPLVIAVSVELPIEASTGITLNLRSVHWSEFTLGTPIVLTLETSIRLDLLMEAYSDSILFRKHFKNFHRSGTWMRRSNWRRPTSTMSTLCLIVENSKIMKCVKNHLIYCILIRAMASMLPLIQVK